MSRALADTTQADKHTDAFACCRRLLTNALLDVLHDGVPHDEPAKIHTDPELQQEQLLRASAWAAVTPAMCDDTNVEDLVEEYISEDPAEEHISEIPDEHLKTNPSDHDFSTLSNVLDNTRAYHWLLAMVRCEMTLAPTEPDRQSLIRKKISEKIPSGKISRHRQSQIYEITIETDWNPWEFFERQQYSSRPEDTAENVIVIVGSETNAQATTCLGYMIQKWPMTGRHTMDCFLGLIKDGSSFSQCGKAWNTSRLLHLCYG